MTRRITATGVEDPTEEVQVRVFVQAIFKIEIVLRVRAFSKQEKGMLSVKATSESGTTFGVLCASAHLCACVRACHRRQCVLACVCVSVLCV